ncbi:MAG: hypothetical protein WBK97_00085 [Bacteroidales bacterium]|jgi:hypothetical protein
MENLEPFGIIPIDYGALCTLYNQYRFPRNKIAALEKEGKIIRLKRGLYVVSPQVSRQLLSVELLANHLYGPSYVSMESALRNYGLIPEQVYTVRSMTLNRSKKYKTSLGYFEYTTVPAAYYPIGIVQQIAGNGYTYLIASPEKALCDLITATPGLRIQSPKAMRVYLEDDIRFDRTALRTLNPDLIRKCMETGKKKNTLEFLFNTIRS